MAEEKQEEVVEETSWDRFKANTKTIGGAVLLAIFIRIVLFEAFEIDGPSMEPSLLNGDRVVVSKFSFGLFLPRMEEAVVTWGAPEVGDVVIVKSPSDGVDIVKRVMGVAGDTIEVRDGIIYRNEEPIEVSEIGPCETEQQEHEDPGCMIYEQTVGDVTFRTSKHGSYSDQTTAPFRIPEGHIYIRGDHRDRSNDSTNPLIGPVPVSRVKGKALFIYLSYEKSEGTGLLDFGEFRGDRFGLDI